MELRIYQADNVIIDIPNPAEIKAIMDKIIHLNDILRKNDEEFM